MSVTYYIDSIERDREQYPDPLNWDLVASQVKTWTPAPKEIKAIPTSHKKNPVDFASTLQILRVDIPYPKPELFGNVEIATSIDALNNIIFPSPHGYADGDRVWTSSGNGGPYGIPSDVPLYVINSTPNTIQISTSSGGSAIPLTPVTSFSIGFVLYTATVQAAYEDAKIVLYTPVLFLTIRIINTKDNRNIRCINGQHSEATHLLFRGGVTQGPDGTPAFLEWYAKAEQTLRWRLDDPFEIRFETRDGKPLDVFKETKADQLKLVDPQRQMLISFIVTPFVRDATYSNHFLEPYEG